MSTSERQQVLSLMEAICADFPRRKDAAEKMIRQLGLDETVELTIGSPEVVARVPTFDQLTFRQLTPMLAARFEYASTWQAGREVWLSAGEMASSMISEAVQDYHKALREDWVDSAPMLFSDQQLSLFGITLGVPDKLTYLVWAGDQTEPEVWEYAGMTFRKFDNLVEYFEWRLKRP